MQELIKKSEKLTDLLKELQLSEISEQYQYVINFEYKDGDTQIYSLYDREKGRVKLDKLERIKSWLKIRGIEQDKIYSINLKQQI